MNNLIILFVHFLVFLALVGCGDGRPARVPVSGQVLIDGQPLTFGTIRFIPAGHRASQGAIDSSGRFTLSCYSENDGAVPGKHRIEVTACERVKPTLLRWHAPKRYQDQATSGLSQEISGPTEDLTIELTWSGGKPFDETFYTPDADYKKLDEADK
jgi:hypothetical protein